MKAFFDSIRPKLGATTENGPDAILAGSFHGSVVALRPTILCERRHE